jgi:hypothetical protein
MNLFINIVFLVIVCGFTLLYLFNLALNYFRALAVNKKIKEHPLTVDAKVIDVIKDKKRVFVKVKYSSPTNYVLLSDVFEFTESEFFDQYYVGQDVKIIYPELSSNKKVTCFPTYLAHEEFEMIEENNTVSEVEAVSTDEVSSDTDANEAQKAKEEKEKEEAKIKAEKEKLAKQKKKDKEPSIIINGKTYRGQKLSIEAGPLVTDLMLFAAGVYILIVTIINLTTPSATTGSTGLSAKNTRPLWISKDGTTNVNDGCLEILFIVAIIVIYFMLFSYILERLTVASPEHNQNYLKLCGIKGTAQVKTYKFGKSKDSQGNKEAQIEIEFYSNKGEKINASLNSYMYSQTQEEFIQILYDPSNPKNVVYMRQ